MHPLELHGHGHGRALIRKVLVLRFMEDGCVSQALVLPSMFPSVSETGQVNKKAGVKERKWYVSSEKHSEHSRGI